jgi:hypothetical protein
VRIIPEGERRKDYDILREKHSELLKVERQKQLELFKTMEPRNIWVE